MLYEDSCRHILFTVLATHPLGGIHNDLVIPSEDLDFLLELAHFLLKFGVVGLAHCLLLVFTGFPVLNLLKNLLFQIKNEIGRYSLKKCDKFKALK